MKSKKGYVLVYSMIAMLVSCSLVISTVTVVLYYGSNINRTVGGNGALYVADSGIEAAENYLNAYYIDKGNIKSSAKDLWATVYDIANEIVPIVEDNHDEKALLLLQGYMNYNYIISSVNRTKLLSEDESLSGSYKVYIAAENKARIRTQGKLTLLCIGEYVYQSKTYYKFITVDVVIEPLNSAGMITGFRLKTVDYSETIKGGTQLWGNITW
ncbi:MAG TPA: hypothetical protein DEB10_13090 [Ruminococcaceae bacterium]|jgi:hypothetical protein|nr:hypothetical protein [Oscillospiraceae bacterium]